MSQITAFAGRERRRRWSEEERLRVLAEAFSPRACVAEVYRRHDISASLIYTWRSKLRQAHARRKFFELADVAATARRRSRNERAGMIYPIALEAVQRIDALFDIERGINGKSAAERLAIRQELSAPLMAELHAWLTSQLAPLSRNHDLAKAINYMLRRWDAFTRFLTDGRICLTNNAAERALRCVPLGRKAWLFRGSDRGGQRAAELYTLIQTARLNNVDPQAWLASVLRRIADRRVTQLGSLLPWNWQPRPTKPPLQHHAVLEMATSPASIARSARRPVA